jgi:predicted lipid-binding transport protein (Tim44 family)
MRQNKKLEKNVDSEKTHFALGASAYFEMLASPYGHNERTVLHFLVKELLSRFCM